MMNKKLANRLSLVFLVLFLVIPTIFSLIWLVHLMTPVPFISILWDINLGSMIIGSLGISIIPKFKSDKTVKEERELNFYSGLMNSLIAVNAGILVLSGIFLGPLDIFKDIAFGIYGMYLLIGMSGLLIATSIFAAGIHIKRYIS